MINGRAIHPAEARRLAGQPRARILAAADADIDRPGRAYLLSAGKLSVPYPRHSGHGGPDTWTFDVAELLDELEALG